MDKENWNNVEVEQPKEEEKIEVELEKMQNHLQTLS